MTHHIYSKPPIFSHFIHSKIGSPHHPYKALNLPNLISHNSPLALFHSYHTVPCLWSNNKGQWPFCLRAFAQAASALRALTEIAPWFPPLLPSGSLRDQKIKANVTKC